MSEDKAPQSRFSTRLLLRGMLWISVATVVAAATAIWWLDQRALEIRMSGRVTTARLMTEGLAMAVKDDVVARNYAQLETRLLQTAADVQVISALVSDSEGRVLSHVKRGPRTQEPQPVYSTAQVVVPTLSPQLTSHEESVVQWLRLDAGVPVGWLRLEIADTEIDHALTHLRQQGSAWLLGACLLLLTVLALVMHRTHRLIQLEESVMTARNRALEKVAYRDSLTGLPNRHMLLDLIEQQMVISQRHHKSFAVCFLDLDGFKEVNDTFGHDAGDQVLREVGRRLEMCVRSHDTVARLGGDEFVLLLGDMVDAHACEDVMKRVLSDILQPIVLGPEQGVAVSSSIGVTLYPADDSAPSKLLEHADQAMYQAKRTGKNRWTAYAN